MKTFLTKNTIVIAGIAVLIAVITIVSVNVFNSSGPVTGLANAVTRPVKAVAASIAQMFEGIYNSIYKYEALQEDYDEARKELADIKRSLSEYYDLLVEVNWLRSLLELRCLLR